MIDKNQFLYPQYHYHGEIKPKSIVFNAKEAGILIGEKYKTRMKRMPPRKQVFYGKDNTQQKYRNATMEAGILIEKSVE